MDQIEGEEYFRRPLANHLKHSAQVHNQIKIDVDSALHHREVLPWFDLLLDDHEEFAGHLVQAIENSVHVNFYELVVVLKQHLS